MNVVVLVKMSKKDEICTEIQCNILIATILETSLFFSENFGRPTYQKLQKTTELKLGKKVLLIFLEMDSMDLEKNSNFS